MAGCFSAQPAHFRRSRSHPIPLRTFTLAIGDTLLTTSTHKVFAPKPKPRQLPCSARVLLACPTCCCAWIASFCRLSMALSLGFRPCLRANELDILGVVKPSSISPRAMALIAAVDESGAGGRGRGTCLGPCPPWPLWCGPLGPGAWCPPMKLAPGGISLVEAPPWLPP